MDNYLLRQAKRQQIEKTNIVLHQLTRRKYFTISIVIVIQKAMPETKLEIKKYTRYRYGSILKGLEKKCRFQILSVLQKSVFWFFRN